MLKKEVEVVRSELDRYLEEAVEDVVPHFDILQWWKTKSSTYRILSRLAHDVLEIRYQLLLQNPLLALGEEYLINFVAS